VKVERTFVEKNRWLIPLFGAESPLKGLCFSLPMAYFFALATIDRTEQHGYLSSLSDLSLGLLYWSFLEYAIHAWFYHWSPKNKFIRSLVESFHVYHHRNPEDKGVINAGPALGILFAALIALPLLALTWNLQQTYSIMLGTLIGYTVYEWCHYLIHARQYRGGYLGYMQRFHFHHHDKNWKVNFSVSNPVWDIILGTAHLPKNGMINSCSEKMSNSRPHSSYRLGGKSPLALGARRVTRPLMAPLRSQSIISSSICEKNPKNTASA
jgi:sterol desaturase/sphingolipid hydroxylase (fatty acid hydroxylase superfamily)